MFSKEAIDRVVAGSRSPVAGKGPVDVQILPVEECNARCLFCPLFTVPNSVKAAHAPRFNTNGRIMEWHIFERIVEGLKSLGKVDRFHLTGGEPLLHPEISRMVKELKSAFPDSSLTLVTNGILLKEHAANLAEAGVDCLSVSINAASPESYSQFNPGCGDGDFSDVREGIKAAAKSKNKGKPYISLTSVLARHNFDEVAGHFDLTLKVGADAMTFIPLVPFEFEGKSSNEKMMLAASEFQSFIKDIKLHSQQADSKGFYLGYAGNDNDGGILSAPDNIINRPCYAGWAFAMFWPDGSVRPCCGCETVTGNLYDSPLETIWNSDEYRKFRANSFTNPATQPFCSCRECGYLAENQLFHTEAATGKVG